MITITPIKDEQITAARQIIVGVAQRIFEPEKSSEEFDASLEDEHELKDMDDLHQVYDGKLGIFLVALDGERVIGTGALKPLAGRAAELKRLWLLEDYHGQSIGYRLVMRLFEFARQAGYRQIFLQTSLQQRRAIDFYKQIGFVEVPDYVTLAYADDISFGITLDG